MRLAIVWTIARKELTETLRDRRTIMMMIALPVLMYPLLMMGFTKLQVSQREATANRASRVAVWGAMPAGLADALGRGGRIVIDDGDGPPEVIAQGLASGDLQRPPLSEPRRPDGAEPAGGALREPAQTEGDTPVLAAARALVADRRVDAVLVLWPGVIPALAEGRAGRVSIYFDSVREDSLDAERRLTDRLAEFRDGLVLQRQRDRGLDEGFSVALDVRSANVAPDQRRSGQILGLFLPFLLIKALLLDGKPASLWIVWLAIAVTPAICEEAFFRGLILAGLRRLGMWPAIIICALLFGLAHSSIYRLLPTVFIGLLLTWLVWRTGSIWTSIVAHALNNGIAATLVYDKELAALVGAGTESFLGWRPTAVATLVLLTGVAVLMRTRQAPQGQCPGIAT